MPSPIPIFAAELRPPEFVVEVWLEVWPALVVLVDGGKVILGSIPVALTESVVCILFPGPVGSVVGDRM